MVSCREQYVIVGNNAIGRISKWVFERKQSTSNFPKNELSLRNVLFSENLTCFVFSKHPFWDSPFGFITDVIQNTCKRKHRSVQHTQDIINISNINKRASTYFLLWLLLTLDKFSSFPVNMYLFKVFKN